VHFTILAYLIAGLHFAFVAFVLAGGVVLYRWQWVAWVHIPCFLYAVMIMLIGWRCPLTDLEIWLRKRAGEPVHWQEFLHHYIWSHVGWKGNEWFITAGLILVAGLVNWRAYLHLMS